MSPSRRIASAIVATTLILSLLVSSAAADEGKVRVKVIADGLDNPRGLAVGPDRALYVAEAGEGGDLSCVEGAEGESCGGLSGAITRITGRGQHRVVTGLPSFAAPDGTAALGPSDISFRGLGRAYVPIDLGNDPAVRDEFPEALDGVGWLARVNVRSGGVRLLADLAGFEARNDPNEDGPDSNPYSVVATRRGAVVADAGANALLDVRKNGRISVIATFPDRMVEAPAFLGMPPGTRIPMDAVPNSVVRGPDGAWYVGQLTGFPFPVGAANVYRVVPGHDPEVYASGFTNIIDIAFARDGSLLVLEIATNGLLSGDTTGRLARFHDGETTTLLTDGLESPAGLAIGRQGQIYVSNHGTSPDAGEVLRVRLRLDD